MWNLVKLILNITGANKVATFAAIAVVAFGSFQTWLYLHDRAVTKAALEQYNKQQEELYNKKVEEFNAKVEQLKKETEALIQKQKEDTKNIISEISDVKKRAAASGEPEPATPYLKIVVEDLNQKYGVK